MSTEYRLFNAYGDGMDRMLDRANRTPRPPSSSLQQTIRTARERTKAALDTYFAARNAIRANERLNDEAKRKDLKAAQDQLMQSASGAVSNLRSQISQHVDALKAASTPPDGISEDQLRNARMDAELALRNVSAAEVIQHLRELIEVNDPAMTHLLLFTPWVEYFSRGRNDTVTPIHWESERRQFMPEYLSGDAAAAFLSLDEATALLELPAYLRNAVYVTLQSEGVELPRFTEFLA